MELLADPESEHFRFEVKVRHDKSNPGKVGVYFGHQTIRGGELEIQYFLRATFDAIGGVQQTALLEGKNLPKLKGDLGVSSDLYAENESQRILDNSMALAKGASFGADGE